MNIAVGTTIATIAKKVLTILLGDKKGRKFLFCIVGIAVFIVCTPLITLIGMLGWMAGDSGTILNKDVVLYNLPQEKQSQISHDQLHRDAAKDQELPELMLYNMASRMEYEPNIVAASILLADEDVPECIYQYHYDAEQTAYTLRTDVNPVASKIESLRHRGYELHRLEHDSKFWK